MGWMAAVIGLGWAREREGVRGGAIRCERAREGARTRGGRKRLGGQRVGMAQGGPTRE